VSTENLSHDYDEIVPFGWTDEIRQLLPCTGRSSQLIPADDVVRHVNSRPFSAQHDPVTSPHPDQLPFGPQAFGQLCRSLNECRNVVQRLNEFGYPRWVAKPQHSHAGRNRLLVTGEKLNQPQQGWLEKQLQQSDSVYIEPWVDRHIECGLQYQIGTSVEFVGLTELLNDPAGRYYGSVISGKDTIPNRWQDAVDHGALVCEAIRAAGYFGPVGLDAFQFVDASNGIATRLCNDINARFTMGRIALQLCSQLLPGEKGYWIQRPASDSEDFVSTFRKSFERPGLQTINGRSVRTCPLLFVGPSDSDWFSTLKIPQ
jgi:hypothetical protein